MRAVRFDRYGDVGVLEVRERLDQVRDAYRELAGRHTHGEIVLVP